ncbi:MAG: YajG family lipoprotein [Gammaproteobacteria bacterium]|nr:YajG family lipoprotein [Gammaproteobacteria bacterium]
MKSVYQTVFFGLLLLLGGCALSPQTVSIAPVLIRPNSIKAAMAKGSRYDVADNRGTAVVGTRGGVYADTSEITTDADVKTPMREELVSALQAMGYRVVQAGEPADAALSVIIDTIKYSAIDKTVGKSIEIAATVRVISKVGNREYTGRYRSKRTTDVLKAPDATENEKMIDAAVSHVLERVLTDSELHTFMHS